MAYNKNTWSDGPAGGTPLSAARLNAMENGIAAALQSTDADARYAQFSPQSMRPFQVALAKRSAQPVRILAFGDSFFEGTGSSSAATLRWQAVLQARLRILFQPAGVPGAALPYISAWPLAGQSPNTSFPVTRTGDVTYSGWSGLGLRLASIGSTGGSLTFTFTGTSCKLLYPQGTFGKLSIVIDGGTPTVIDQYGASLQGGKVWSSPALTRGSHTVVVSRDATSVSGRGCAVEGLLTFDGDETTGVRVLDAGHHGLDTTAPLDSFNVQFWPASVTAAGPYAMILLGLGLNDASVPRTVATYQANMASIINILRTTCGHTGTIGLVYWPPRSVGTAAYISYRDALTSLMASDPNLMLIPMADRMPAEGSSYTDPTNLGLYDATDHPNDFGQAFIADTMTGYLTPR